MATLQPAGYFSERRHRSRSPGVERLRLETPEPRRRSRSRTPRPYDPDSPKHYRPNESRMRKPPKSPTIEDEGLGDDEVCLRGKLEQKPIIIPANGEIEPVVHDIPDETSSSGSLSSSEDEKRPRSNGTRRPKESSTSANGNTPADNVHANTRPPASGQTSDPARGRPQAPPLKTDLDKPIRLERERSPYASGPATSARPDPRFSKESLLSPTLQSPLSPDKPRPASQRPPAYRRYDSDRPSAASSYAQAPPRPSLDRRASAMPDLGRSSLPTSPVQARRRPGAGSSDESESERSSQRGHVPLMPAGTRPRPVVEAHRDDPRKMARESPPRTPTASDYPKSQGLNREALLNGAAASLTSLLDGHQRKASPRNSPHVSPNSSPYPSPPRTPPEHHRPHPVSSLKYDSSTVRPSSPLHTSSKLDAGRMPLAPEQDAGASRYQPRSRASSPMPQARRPEPEVPKIDVRSPSPLPPKHSKSISHDTTDTRTPSRYLPPAYAAPATTLQPTRPDFQRQRSMSNSELQRPRPSDLGIKPPVFDPSDVEYLSPTAEQGPSAFRALAQNGSSLLSPTAMDHHQRNSIAGLPTRSHSAIPRPDQPPSQVPSTMPLALSRPRSRSSAPAPDMAYSDLRQPDPVQFPLCPRPKPVAGYRDWYSVKGCDPFVICRDCRDRIFGRGYDKTFRRFEPETSSEEITCVINDPWLRMACLAGILQGSKDLKLAVDLALENEDRSPCPQRTPAQRDWYYLPDPEENGKFLADFRVCSHCAHSIYSLFPKLDRVFQRGDDLDEELLLCSLRSADPARFGQYVSHCEKAEQAAIKSNRKHPDMSDFIWYHKKETVISECTLDQVLIGRDWHFDPDFQDFTVCEECYYEVVRPEAKKGAEIAQSINPVAKHINNGVSCNLYSPRMKEVFRIACEDDDFKYLQKNVLQRQELQIKIMAAKMAVQKNSHDKEAQEELDDYMRKWRKGEREKYAERD